MPEGESGEFYRNGDEKPMENDPEEKEGFRNGRRQRSRHHPFLGFLSKAAASGTTSEQLTSLICSTQYQLAMYKTKITGSTLATTAAFTSTDASNLLLAAAEIASIAGSSRGNALRLVKYVVCEEDRWNGSEAFEKALVRGWRGLPMTLLADAGFMALSSPKMRILELAGLKFICDIEATDPQWQLASIKLLGTLSSKGDAKSRESLAKRLKAVASFNNLNLYLVQEIVGQAKRALKHTKQLPRGEEEKEEDPLLEALNDYEKQQHLYEKDMGQGYQDGQKKEGLWQTDFCGQENLQQQHTNSNRCTNRESSTDCAQECRVETTRLKESMGSSESTPEGTKDKTEQGNERKTSNKSSKRLREDEGGNSEMLQMNGVLDGRTTLAEKHKIEYYCEEHHLEPRIRKERRVLDEEHGSMNGAQQNQQMCNINQEQQSECHDEKGVVIGEEEEGVKESMAAADISNLMTHNNKKGDDIPILQNIPRTTTAFCASSSCESTSPMEAGAAAFAVHHEADDRETFYRQGDAKPEESLHGEPPCHVPVGCQEGRKYEVVLGRGWNSMAHTSSQAQQLTGGRLLCIHYDFLPQSADMEEPGELKLRGNGTASVELKSMDKSGTPLSYEGSYVSRMTKSIQSNSVLRFTKDGHFVLEPVEVIVQGLRNDFAETSKGVKKRLLHTTPKPSHGKNCGKIGDDHCEPSSPNHDWVGGRPIDTALCPIGGHLGGFKAKLQKMGSRVEKSKGLQKVNLENQRSIMKDSLPKTD